MQFFGGKKPANAKSIADCNGCWNAKAEDGTYVTYRPATTASEKTLETTASVDLNNPAKFSDVNNGKPVKLKFPLSGTTGAEK